MEVFFVSWEPFMSLHSVGFIGMIGIIVLAGLLIYKIQLTPPRKDDTYYTGKRETSSARIPSPEDRTATLDTP